MTTETSPLTPQQIDTYLRDGILVVDNLLSREEIIEAHEGLSQTLKDEYGVDVHDLEGTGHGLIEASSTNGAGGVLDIFYPDWKMKIATNETLFRMTCQLWKEAYCHSGESLEDFTNVSSEVDGCNCNTAVENCDEDYGANKRKDDSFKWHPFGAFDHDKGYTFIDRIGYRIPTKIAESIGKQLTMSKDTSQPTQAPPPKKKKPKSRAIQRSLTPHFDCCPEKYHDTTTKNKWRPIQCFVSLTDNLQPNTGGFEAVPGFHREFRSWAENGRRVGDNEPLPESQSQSPHPQPCVGEYTHLSPSEDRALMKRVQHIPVTAGSVVFWDNRIPHANSYRNDPPVNSNDDGNNCDATSVTGALGTSGSRAVVYCSYLPDVDVNRCFVQRQLEDWKLQRAPRVGDRWIRQDDDDGKDYNDVVGTDGTTRAQLNEVGERLIGLVEWT